MIVTMMSIKAVAALLSLVCLSYAQHEETTGSSNPSRCENAPPAAPYWTGWYSSSEPSLIGETANFAQICADIIETQCREKYTHRSLNETGLFSSVSCTGGVLSCRQNCEDVEMRLLCRNTTEMLPEPDLHWSLSELDTGRTRGAIESWACNDKVVRVEPVKGGIVGEVEQGKGLRQSYSPSSHHNLCGVRTNGLASLSFRPFVQNCLTSPDCCNADQGISVMFWLRKDEMEENESRPQSVPLYVFRSPTLVATVQNGHLIVTYLHVNGTWTVNRTLADSEWVHVTIIFDPITKLKVYLNSNEGGEAIQSSSSTPFNDVRDEFNTSNTSFQIFSNEGNVTSSEIRPIAMTDLKIFFTALTMDLIERMFRSEREEAPPKVLRMAISEKTFKDSVTQEELHHIKLTCLIRDYSNIDRDDIRFMYKTTQGNFEDLEMTSNDSFMKTYLEENNEYRKTAVAQIFGRRNTEPLPSFFTCKVASANPLSVYGYEIIQSKGATNLDDIRYYNWTRFFDSDTSNGGNQDETLATHLSLAKREGFEMLCQNPAYAECRTKDEPPDIEPQQWYEVTPSFVPDFNFWCEGKGIQCTRNHEDNQECPDLEVRYACPVSNTTMSNSTTNKEEHVSTARMPVNTTQSTNKSEEADTSTDTINQAHVTKPQETDTTSPSNPDGARNSTPPTAIDTGTSGVTSRLQVTHDRDVSDVYSSTTTAPPDTIRATPLSTQPSDLTPEPVVTKQARDTETSPASNDVSTAHNHISTTPDAMVTTPTEQAHESSTSTAPTSSSSATQSASTSTPAEDILTPDTNEVPKETNPTPDTNGALHTAPQESTVLNSSPTESEDASVTSVDTDTSMPTTAPLDDKDSTKSTGNEEETIYTKLKANLNYLYPVMIVALGVGIPTLAACYYLCRKRTPSEIEEQRLIAERKEKLAKIQNAT